MIPDAVVLPTTTITEHTPHCIIVAGTGPDGLPYLTTYPDDDCDHPNHTESSYQ